MEKFEIYHHKKVKPRNRLESLIIDYTKNLLKDPLDMTIEEVHNNILKMIEYTSKQFRQKGVCLSEPHVSCTFVGSPNKVERSFGLYGRGRGTSTLTIRETIAKDESKNFAPYVETDDVATNISEAWIKIEDLEPIENSRVLVVLDYTKWGRDRRVELANVFFSEHPVAYGGPISLTGRGYLTGTYFALPSIVAPKVVTHWRHLPELP